jgi:hypothetical protein
MTVFPPASFQYGSIANYDFNIYSGWFDNTPGSPIFSANTRNIEWNLDDSRDSGWVFISLIKENILLNKNEEYYVEFKYNGTGALYPFDPTSSSDSSFIRDDYASTCNVFQLGDWNIRAVLSGKNCGAIPDNEIWPGDMNNDLIVDADDIIPLGRYFGSQGCYRLGDAYLWEAQPYPDGWDEEEAARADANGDGFVNIADLLVILINWDKSVSGSIAAVANDENTAYISLNNLEDYRSNFYQLYESMSGDSEPEIMMRKKLEEIFEFEPKPAKYILSQSYPNPFNARTTIPYYISDKEEVMIIVYDMRGRIVENFSRINNQEGWHEVVFNADNISSGIYFYRLVNEEKIISQKKMTLMK